MTGTMGIVGTRRCVLCVDAWLGWVIGCVAEVGHVRPRTGHATGVCFAFALPGAFSDAPADGHGELAR